MTSTLLLTLVIGQASAAGTNTAADRDLAVHVLNRAAFGPRPGDVERVMSKGVASWIEEQLQPSKIADDAVEKKLVRYKTLQMSTAELWDAYYQPMIEARRARKNAADKSESMSVTTPGKSLGANRRPRRVVAELTAAKLVRAVESERQLNEVMADFWMNHFNVFAGKGLDRIFITAYERDTIRPLMWGKFEDLLLATAKSPAMLFYLDNARSVAEGANVSATSQRRNRKNGQRRQKEEEGMTAKPPAPPRGLNENYARELLELHTLGVDGGYTQKDVTELARALTGWGIDRPQRGAPFRFRAALHDTKPKTVLKQSLSGKEGVAEGETIIRFLARHPSTARHLATKLVERFVSDTPPPALVDRVARKFLATNGDLRETLRTLLLSEEFLSTKYAGKKIKTPFEFVTSSIRAVGGTLNNPVTVANAIREMGQRLYFAQPPTGYSDRSEDWVSSSGLVQRLNFALAVSDGSIAGLRRPVGTSNSSDVEPLAMQLTGKKFSQKSVLLIESKTKNVIDMTPDKRQQLMTGLILGAPEFQAQ